MAYTNSSLITYKKISPMKNSPRNHAIDTITIHCMAGNLSVETCGNVFQTNKASSNYGIGTDGRIALYVDEKDRSWATSSSSNDNRAVTIEVANDGGAPDWHVSDKAMASLINLIADICKRNNIKKLVWSTNKTDRVNHLNGCNMTVHRDYANKACPGNYLYGKHSYIASEVNKKLTATTTTTKPTITLALGSPNIKNGSKTEQAKVLQNNLNALFNSGLVADGIFGAKSVTALKTAQKIVGVTADGIYGNGTRTAFKTYAEKKGYVVK